MTENNVPFSLDTHRFLIDLLTDPAEEEAIIKCAQVGVSTVEILRVAFQAQNGKQNIIYTLPAGPDRDLFVDSKVDPLFEANPCLFESLVSSRKEMKQIGSNFIFFRGTELKKEAVMLSGGWLIHDEIDQSDQKNIETYKSRLKAKKSSERKIIRLSNPTFPGQGIDKYWEISDQKHWMVKCSEALDRRKVGLGRTWEPCGYEWYLSWPDSVDMQRKILICQNCGKEITAEERRMGRWVAKYPGRRVSGYWISHMVAPWITAADIIDDYNTTDRANFFNMTMGVVYAGSDDTVNRAVLNRNLREGSPTGTVVAGVDQGDAEKHIVIGQPDGVTSLYVVKEWFSKDAAIDASGKREHSVQSVFELHCPETAVIDTLPDLKSVRELKAMFPNVVIGAIYQQDWRNDDPYTFNEKKASLNASRPRVIDELVVNLTEGKFGYYYEQDKKQHWERYCKHFEALYRKEIEREGNVHWIWDTHSADHFVHATIYFRLACKRAELMHNPEEERPKESGPVEALELPDGFETMMQEDKTLDWMLGG